MGKSSNSKDKPKDDHEAYLVKILLLGDATVGKSQLLVRFAESRFDPNSITSIGVDTRYKMMICRGRKVKVQIWDAAGSPELRATVSSAYYEKANGVLIVYDITNHASFEMWKLGRSKSMRGVVTVYQH
jgi:small GTP-binding protein